jgi:heme-degrading monooxygenase HmoA
MICRIWRGWTTPQNAAAYEEIVRGEVIPEIEARRIRGFRAIELMRRSRDDAVEFATIMWFDDLDAVKRFVGEDYATAHVPQRARNVLARFDERSAHYEILDHREQPPA